MENTNTLIKNMTIDIISTTAIFAIINQYHTYAIIDNNSSCTSKSFSYRPMCTISSMLSVFGISMFFMSRYK